MTRLDRPQSSPGGRLAELLILEMSTEFHRVMEYSHDLDNGVNVPVDEEVSRPVHPADGVRHMVAAQLEMPGEEVSPKVGTPRGPDAFGLGSYVAECRGQQCLIAPPG